VLRVRLLTRGSPKQVSGGHLYQRHLALAASTHGASMEVISLRRGPLDAFSAVAEAGGIVVVDSLVAWSLAPALLVRRRRPRLVALVHQVPGGVDHGRIRTGVQRRLDLLVYRRCDLVIAVSEPLRQSLVSDHGLDAVQVRVIEPGSDLPAGNRGSSGGAANELRQGRRIAALNVANWLPNKGIVELLDAVAALPGDDVTLHLVGRDDVAPDYTERVRARLADRSLAGRVVVHGLVPPEDLAGFYAAADVFVLTSRGETYGTVFGEALRAGVPVIAWRAGSLDRLLEDGREGRLLEPGDIEAVSAALHRAASDPVWLDHLRRSAAAGGQGLPTWNATAAGFFAALRELTG
jgi:glycosyltransferase involved in cell wall biosynthesis